MGLTVDLLRSYSYFEDLASLIDNSLSMQSFMNELQNSRLSEDEMRMLYKRAACESLEPRGRYEVNYKTSYNIYKAHFFLASQLSKSLQSLYMDEDVEVLGIFEITETYGWREIDDRFRYLN